MYVFIYFVLSVFTTGGALRLAFQSPSYSDWVEFWDGGGNIQLSAPEPLHWEDGAQTHKLDFGEHKPHSLMVFGAYLTGTNILTTVLDILYPDANVCPGGERIITHEHCFDPPGIGKHENPFFIEQWLKHNKSGPFKILMVLRNPLSFLASLYKHPYGFETCINSDDWLNHTCDCATLENEKLCTPKQRNLKLSNVWNIYASMYKDIQESWKGKHKIALLRYEDLVLDPLATLNKIAADLNIPKPSSEAMDSVVDNVLAISAKNNGIGRELAIKKVTEKLYLTGYTKDQIQTLCGQLDNKLLSMFGYTDDCS